MPDKPQSSFDTPSLRMMRNVIQEHLAGHSPPIIVLGEPGAGKTTLLERIARDSDDIYDVCLFRAARVSSDATSLHEAILRHWLPGDAQTASTSHLLHVLCDAPPDHPPLLIIDDANHLSRAELKGILGLKHAIDQDAAARFGLILCDGSVLEPRIAALTPEFGHRQLPVSLGLRPLTRQETETFVRHRDQTLTSNDVAHLYRTSRGLPGLLIRAIATEDKSPIQTTSPIRKQLLFAAGAFAFIVIAVALLLPASPKHTHTHPLPLPPTPAAVGNAT